MERDEKLRILEQLYLYEKFHGSLYYKLSLSEKDGKLKRILQRLSELEKRHERLWAEIIRMNGAEPKARVSQFQVHLVFRLRKILGLALTVKAIEYLEDRLHGDLETSAKKIGLAGREKTLAMRIINETNGEERRLEDSLIEHGNLLGNIRDVIFGMNDGLVELLGVIVGLAAAIANPILVLLGGMIVATAGTLSMAGGAYLSTEYEEKLARPDELKESKAPLRSAFYVGVMYFVGTLFPLSPFAFGFSGETGIVLAIIVTAIVLTIVSVLIAFISGTSIRGRVSKTLLVSLGIAAITIAIGIYARTVLNLPPP